METQICLNILKAAMCFLSLTACLCLACYIYWALDRIYLSYILDKEHCHTIVERHCREAVGQHKNRLRQGFVASQTVKPDTGTWDVSVTAYQLLLDDSLHSFFPWLQWWTQSQLGWYFLVFCNHNGPILVPKYASMFWCFQSYQKCGWVSIVYALPVKK